LTSFYKLAKNTFAQKYWLCIIESSILLPEVQEQLIEAIKLAEVFVCLFAKAIKA